MSARRQRLLEGRDAWALARAAALERYARLRRDGRPAVCVPPQKVEKDREERGLVRLKPKVIFDTVENAEEFAALVVELGDGPSWPYPCQFSRHGHVHLTSNPHHRPCPTD